MSSGNWESNPAGDWFRKLWEAAWKQIIFSPRPPELIITKTTVSSGCKISVNIVNPGEFYKESEDFEQEYPSVVSEIDRSVMEEARRLLDELPIPEEGRMVWPATSISREEARRVNEALNEAYRNMVDRLRRPTRDTRSLVTLTGDNIVDYLIDVGTVMDLQNFPNDDRFIYLPYWTVPMMESAFGRRIEGPGDLVVDRSKICLSGDLATVRRGNEVICEVKFGHPGRGVFLAKIRTFIGDVGQPDPDRGLSEYRHRRDLPLTSKPPIAASTCSTCKAENLENFLRAGGKVYCHACFEKFPPCCFCGNKVVVDGAYFTSKRPGEDRLACPPCVEDRKGQKLVKEVSR